MMAVSGVRSSWETDGDEVALHLVQLAQLLDGLLFLCQQMLQPRRLVGERLVLLGKSIGQGAALEVHLSGEGQRREEHGNGPLLADPELDDDRGRQSQADVLHEELRRGGAVHPGDDLSVGETRGEPGRRRDDGRVDDVSG